MLSNFDKNNETQHLARLVLSYFPAGVEPQEKLLFFINRANHLIQVTKDERDVKKSVIP